MNTTRREFIKTSALAVAGGALLSSCSFSSPVKKELMGLQLYCVRDEMKELIDRGVEIEYYFQGNKLPEGYFGMDFEIRMILPLNPVQL